MDGSSVKDLAYSKVIVYVGDRPAWKTPLNVFRADPWKLTDIPTIIKLRDGVEESRLVEKDIAGGLAAFIKE
ncbi:hypothetical protein Hypma_015891 [Hypsizygus marmoreus]|uniref:Thioredoxin domain-containing protein n=1 Tax=Hypsizygus marmoreus TaxID=39966 RepID=A0A369K5L9_HYPMA|nr:hypothetical protein Hypma_015891 [Hypsizygus marmoreus]